MPKQTLEPDLYEAFTALLAGLKLLQAALVAANGTTPNPLAVVIGEGRGSKKPRAKLKGVGGDDAA